MNLSKLIQRYFAEDKEGRPHTVEAMEDTPPTGSAGDVGAHVAPPDPAPATTMVTEDVMPSGPNHEGWYDAI